MRELDSAPLPAEPEWWRREADRAVRPIGGEALGPDALAEHARVYLPESQRHVGGNRCALLRDGVEAFPEMLRAIESARAYVRLETYMFLDDAVGRVFAKALCDAARRGVEVRVLYDALGSMPAPRAFFRQMREAGVVARPFRPFSLSGLRNLIHRDHRKLLIVDGELAFIGGINIASHWAPKGVGLGWRDDVLRIEGPAVRQLERRFGAIWRLQHFRLRQQRRPRRELPKSRGSLRLCVISSRRGIHRAYLHAINRAKERVLIAAAYFIPDRKMVQALKDAAARGVEVRLLLNHASDHPLLTLASRGFYQRLLDAGIRIHEWQRGVLHAKTAVVDGVWGTIGSFNLERMSLHYNHETNVVFADPRMARAIERSFETDCALCRPVEPGRWRARPLWQKVLERFCYLFRLL